MSNAPAVRGDEHLVQAAAAAPHPYEDAQMRQLLRRNRLVAATIARMSGLNPSLVGDDIEQTVANVEAVGLALAPFGVQLNTINVNQFDQIPPKSGQMVPRCQLLMALVTELTGDEIWADPDNDDTRATVYLKRADTGRVYKATYTIDQARRSHALDFTFVRWQSASGGSGKRFPAETMVVGTDEAEVYANRASWPTWAEGEPKCNPAWHGFREDMLERRAYKRVIKAGRPGVTAGVLVLDRPVEQPPAATITVNMDFDGEVRPQLGAGDVADEAVTGERYEVQTWELNGSHGWGVWDTVAGDWTGGWFGHHVRTAAEQLADLLNASLAGPGADDEIAGEASGGGDSTAPATHPDGGRARPTDGQSQPTAGRPSDDHPPADADQLDLGRPFE